MRRDGSIASSFNAFDLAHYRPNRFGPQRESGEGHPNQTESDREDEEEDPEREYLRQETLDSEHFNMYRTGNFDRRGTLAATKSKPKTSEL